MKNIKFLLAFSSLLILSLVLLPGCKDDEPGTGGGSSTTSGCTDASADNYNANATEDDGSCIFSGCTDPEANNYDAGANNDDGSCSYDRDAFLGEYLGEFTCDDPVLAPILNSDSLNFEVKVPVDDQDKSQVFFSLLIGGFPVDLESTVMGETLTMSDTIRDFVIPDVDLPVLGSTTITADVIGNGSATVSGDDVDGSIDLEMNITDPAFPGVPLDFMDNCILFGKKK